jgi:hypothetical protein
MNAEQRIDEILQAVNTDGNKSRLNDVLPLFFTLREIVFLCDRDRPRSPLVVNYNHLPTLLAFTSAEKARAYAERSANPKLFHDDGSPVTLTLAKDEAISFIVAHFKNGVKQFLLNCGSGCLFGTSSDDFLRELNRHNGTPMAPSVDVADEFDALVKQLQEGYSAALEDDFWRKVLQLEKVFVVCPPDASEKPDLQFFETAGGQRKLFAIAFTNERQATAYAVRKGYVTKECRQLNMFAISCSALIDSLKKAGELGLYGLYFNPLTRPFHATLPELIERKE